MYYPRFTKVIIDYFMAKDLSIPRRNKMFWHYARDDPMFTTIRIIFKHQDTQLYGVLLPQHLTNKAMLESKAYKTKYVKICKEQSLQDQSSRAYATGEKIPKPKYVKNKADPKSSPKKKSALTSKGKRLKTLAKVTKPAKKKQPATMSKEKGLNVLSEVALSEAEQMKLASKRSKTHFHSSHASGSGADEGTDDADKEDDDDQEDADNKDDDGQEDDNEQTDSDNDNLSVQTPSHYESTDDEESDEVTQGGNVEGEELNEETYEEEDVNELYRDVNQSSYVSSGFISNMLNPNPDTGIDSILNLNTESTSLGDVPVSTTIEMPPSSIELRLWKMTSPNSNKQTNLLLQFLQFLALLIHFINKLDDNIKKIIKENVKAQVKEQVTKILPQIKKTINEQLEAEILTHSSNEAKTSHVIAANLSVLELKKIIIDKMESNKSIHRSDHQKTLYKALVDAYESDKLILDTYRDTIIIKRRRDDQDEDEEPSAGSNRGSKRRRARKEPESTSALKEKTSKSFGRSIVGSKSHHMSAGKSAQAEKPIHADVDLEEPAHQEESAHDVYSMHKIIAITKLQIVKWHNYKHLDWITVRRNKDKLYTFKEGDYKRLRLQDIEDMLLLLVQEALSSKGVWKIFTYPNPRGFIYQNKDKKNKLIRIDELYKFSDGTLNDVWNALYNILKRIRMKYLPQTYWKKVDKDRAGAMIPAIDKMLKNRRIMRSLKKLVSGRPYEGDFWLLQRTI
ncbi:hypothetical protein Tco_1245590 [Tanacetum coccineum]